MLKSKGFTLIDLPIVVAIIGILFAIGVLIYQCWESDGASSPTYKNKKPQQEAPKYEAR